MALAIAPSTDLVAHERRNLHRLESRISRGLQTFRDVGAALLEIRDSRLYRETHSSFEAYCAERWGMNRLRAYQLMDSAKVVTLLGDPAELTNEAQAREFATLTDQPDKAKQVWSRVTQLAQEAEKPVTANLIRQVKAEVLPTTRAPEGNSQTDRLVQDITRLAATFQRWKASRPNIGERRRVQAAIQRFTEAV